MWPDCWRGGDSDSPVTLNEKQALFTYKIAHLIVWARFHGIDLIGAEWYRTKEQAEIYAARGVGIKTSLHRLKLALDIFRLKDGKVTWDVEDYRVLGEKWKTMHPLARWGGNFINRDAVHFSFEHRGVK